MPTFLKILILACCLVCSACSQEIEPQPAADTNTQSQAAPQWRELKAGMTRDDVVATLGEAKVTGESKLAEYLDDSWTEERKTLEMKRTTKHSLEYDSFIVYVSDFGTIISVHDRASDKELANYLK